MNVFNLSLIRCTVSSSGKIVVKKAENSQQSSAIKTIHTLSGNLAYSSGKNQFDLAIVELINPFELNRNVQTISLPTVAIGPGVNLTVTGWGTTSESKMKHT